jgi:hypothetical protein
VATPLKSVRLGDKTLSVPIIQGGMGIGVSLHNLVSAVMREDAMGVISAAQPGFREPDFYQNSLQANIRGLGREIALSRELSGGKGLLGVNVMVAGRQHKQIWEFLNTQPIDAIISGAGLPLDLPQIVTNPDILLAPIVSSGKAARLIMTVWEKRTNRLPDFIVIEGPLGSSGHLQRRDRRRPSATFGRHFNRCDRRRPSGRRAYRTQDSDLLRRRGLYPSGYPRFDRKGIGRRADGDPFHRHLRMRRASEIQTNLVGCEGRRHRLYHLAGRLTGEGREHAFRSNLGRNLA